VAATRRLATPFDGDRPLSLAVVLNWENLVGSTSSGTAAPYVTGLVNQQLLLENEYLAAENRILKARLQPGWRLSDGERATPGGNRQAFRSQRPGAGCASRQTRYHSRLVSTPGG
jgi:hypothetical protein